MPSLLATSFAGKVLPLLLPTTSDLKNIKGYGLTTLVLQKISSTNRTITATPASIEEVQRSRKALNNVLGSGATIYGVNTGFGGSAGARTDHHEDLQVALIQMLNSASYNVTNIMSESQNLVAALDGFEDNDIGGTNMPVNWVRAAMLVRANTLLRGHSGITQETVNGLMKLLNEGITPIIPVRGSISASGDLTPLSFVVSTLQGNPTTMVYNHSDLNNIKVVAADEALEQIKLRPLVCGPKEALALVVRLSNP